MPLAIASLAGQVLGRATADIKVDRIAESPLANSLTDLLRRIAAADVAFINTGGIRAPIGSGDVTYEALFRVIPFNNHGVMIGPMPASALLKALIKSAQTCGDYGALMQSGLKVQIEKDCDVPANKGHVDPNARLTHVETLGGKVLLDTATGVAPTPADDPTLTVVTLDFLAAGGSGYDMFKGMLDAGDPPDDWAALLKAASVAEAQERLQAAVPKSPAGAPEGRPAASSTRSRKHTRPRS